MKNQNICESKNLGDNTALTFGDFTDHVIDFCYKHRIAVFIGGPAIFLCIWFPIAVSIDSRILKELDTADFWGSFLFPFFLSALIYCCFLGDTGNHPAKGNELTLGCFLSIIIVPLLYITYYIYRLVRFLSSKLDTNGNACRNQSVSGAIEEKVRKLNELFRAGVITKTDYDEQLSRLISKC